MATKAADFLQKEGPDKAFAAFNAGGDWRDGDLYVFVIDKRHMEVPWSAARGDWYEGGSGQACDQRDFAIDKNGWVDYN